MSEVDAVVIGAGVVGAAIARALAHRGYYTVLLDGEPRPGTWTSSRNSEVIHAGLYYPPASLKAKLCVRGRELLYAYCGAHGIPHRRIGKLIVASNLDQSSVLEQIMRRGADVGSTNLRHLSRKEAEILEPSVVCHEAIFSPQTGIIDSHSLISSLVADAEAAGAIFANRTRVSRLVRRNDDLWSVFIEGEREPAVSTRIVVNSAGLEAHRVAAVTEGLPSAHVLKHTYARGVYYFYNGRVPFTRLIYPTPVPGGLGTHLTFDLQGSARFGPNVEWVDKVDYAVNPDLANTFAASVRSFWPDVDASRLSPGYAGIRPKLGAPGSPAADFAIEGPETHACPGLVNLFGIESPGLTASLAIAEHVGSLVR